MRFASGALLFVAALALVPACKDRNGAGSIPKEASSLIERTSAATLAWNVDENGKTSLAVRSPLCESITDQVTGKLKFIGLSKGTEQEATLEPHGEQLVAQGPPLDADLTEVQYELDVAGTPVRGALHLPKDGTKGLVAAAPDATTAKADSEQAEQGGTIVSAGDDKLEVVADSDTGVVKVFELGPKPAKKEVLLGIGGEDPGVLVLRRMEGPRVHYAGLLPNDGVGRPLTLAFKRPDGKTEAVVLGLRKREARYVGDDAPRLPIWKAKGWDETASELEKDPKANAHRVLKAKRHGEDAASDRAKIEICHRPPGNPGNAKTLEVAPSALRAHLAHGDTEGPCGADERGKPGPEGKSKGELKGKAKGKSKSKGRR